MGTAAPGTIHCITNTPAIGHSKWLAMIGELAGFIHLGSVSLTLLKIDI